MEEDIVIEGTLHITTVVNNYIANDRVLANARVLTVKRGGQQQDLVSSTSPTGREVHHGSVRGILVFDSSIPFYSGEIITVTYRKL